MWLFEVGPSWVSPNNTSVGVVCHLLNKHYQSVEERCSSSKKTIGKTAFKFWNLYWKPVLGSKAWQSLFGKKKNPFRIFILLWLHRTYVLVAAKPITIGRLMCIRCLYGFRRVGIKRVAGSATNIRKSSPQIHAAMKRPRSWKIFVTSSILATATRIKLSTPIGVVLNVQEWGFRLLD